MITPIVTSLSREVIATVPAIDKEGAYALGATRLEMIRGAVWPHSKGGIIGAVLLGLGRAMGETIAAALVIGSSATITSHLFAPGYNMPAVIANQFGEASGVFRAALMGLGVLLFVFTIIINIVARAIVGRSARAGGCLMAVTTGQPRPDLREPAGWRRTKNRIATVADGARVRARDHPAGVRPVHGDRQGRLDHQLVLPDQPDPAAGGARGRGRNRAGGTRHDRDHGSWPRSWPCRSASWARSTSTSTAAEGVLARLIGFMSDVMTGVPSIVMGLFIFSIWVLHFGFSGFAGALALGCLMLPIVIRSTYEMLKLVPDPLREGSYALGATKARVTVTVVLPAAIGGIVSGALLAVARAAGETAPLLFTILTVTTANPNVFSGANTALPSQIFANATSPYTGAQGRAWGAALTLIVIAFVLMVAARFVTARFTRYSR